MHSFTSPLMPGKQEADEDSLLLDYQLGYSLSSENLQCNRIHCHKRVMSHTGLERQHSCQQTQRTKPLHHVMLIKSQWIPLCFSFKWTPITCQKCRNLPTGELLSVTRTGWVETVVLTNFYKLYPTTLTSL